MGDRNENAQVTALTLELSVEDIELLRRIVAARSAELADEGLSASPISVIRSWIRREARRRGLLGAVRGAGAPAPTPSVDADDDLAPPSPVSGTLPVVLAPPTSRIQPDPSAEPTMVSGEERDNPLDAHPSLAPLPGDKR